VKRTGRDRFVRNVLIAAGNSGDPILAPVVEQLLDDRSPLVRAMAIWALQRLAPSRWWVARRHRSGRETDPNVSAEWGVH
jgi:epoxyqueuosine reductase